MKRYFHLFEQVVSFENLLAAFYEARKGKRHKRNVARFEARLEEELFWLKETLSQGSYRPGPYRTFKIYEPKERIISAAPFRDRVVHHAICRVIEPIFEPTFIFDSYANRKGKGTHAGIRRCEMFCRKYRYVLKADIRKFFPSIDHQILKDLLARKIGCRRTLDLLYLIIDASNPQEPVDDLFAGDDLFTVLRRKGLPMGNLTSQFMANLYLSPLDHFVKETLRFPGYARYVDDFVLFANDKRVLHQARQEIAVFLATHLRLRLHPVKCQVFPVEAGVDFLGQHITARVRRLRPSNVRRFWKRTHQQLKGYFEGTLPPERLEASLNSWCGHARQAHARGLEQHIYSTLYLRGVWICRSPRGIWRVF